MFPEGQKVDFVKLISGLISLNKSRSCFSFCMNFAFFLKRGFLLFILVLSAGFLGLLHEIEVDFFGSSGNSPFRAFSAKSEASSISAETLNLLGLMDRGETVLLREK